MANFKTCTSCQNTLEATTDNFYASPNKGRFGVEAKCKQCRLSRMNTIRREDGSEERRERERVRSRTWRRENPEYVKKYDSFYRASGRLSEVVKARRKIPEIGDKMRKFQRDWRRQNREKVKGYEDSYLKNNPEQRARTYKKHRLKTKYGISLEVYLAACEEQRDCCFLCQQPTDMLVVDHDHACCPGVRSCGKCVRGLLCSLCNFMLGASKDNREVLLRAVDYLDNPPRLSSTRDDWLDELDKQFEEEKPCLETTM